MVLIRLNSELARKIISPRESKDKEKLASLERAIQEGKWDQIPPIWVTPNFVLNGMLGALNEGYFKPTIKPFIIYNGHNRFIKAVEYGLPILAYVRYTPGNPKMPRKEELSEEFYF